MPAVMLRSLYRCGNAKVRGDKIQCDKGHRLWDGRLDGSISSLRLQRGSPLKFVVCQECKDFDDMGPEVPAEERGWRFNNAKL